MPLRTLLFTSATLAAGILSAQPAAVPVAPLAPQSAFESFLRVAATVGKPVTELARIWPAPLTSASSPRRLSVTAAHAIEIDIDGTQAPRDSLARVRRATWAERVADTVALARRVTELMTQLQRIAGPVERCSGLMGPPAYLFALQTVTRSWQKGLAGQPTRLTWDVNEGARYSITIIVGEFAGGSGAEFACDAKRP